MLVSFYSFAWTFGIGLPVLGYVAWFTHRPEGRSWVSRVIIATVVALIVTPTVWSPYGKTYVEAAAVVLLCGVIGSISPVFSFLVGGLPVMLVTSLIYGAWRLSQRGAA